MSAVCDATRLRRLLSFRYEGLDRVVAPYCHGTSKAGKAVLRAVQVGGKSRSGRLDIGKLWTLDRISRLALLEQAFEPTDPDYNPDDSAMLEIHCRVSTVGR